jgi:hypothetical protein
MISIAFNDNLSWNFLEHRQAEKDTQDMRQWRRRAESLEDG